MKATSKSVTRGQNPLEVQNVQPIKTETAEEPRANSSQQSIPNPDGYSSDDILFPLVSDEDKNLIHSQHTGYLNTFPSSNQMLGSFMSVAIQKDVTVNKDSYENRSNSYLELEPISQQENNQTRERSFTCTVCKKSFTQSNTLKTHLSIHTGEKPFKCQYCKKSFRILDYLRKHIRSHTGEKPYKCELCGRSFVQKSSLNIHHRNMHTKKIVIEVDP